MRFAHDDFGPPPPDWAHIPPRAHHYEVGFCGHCPNIHIMFFDENGKGLVQATMSEAQVANLLVQITDYQLDKGEL